MFKKFLLLFLLGHILAHFYVQTDKMMDQKRHSKKWTLLHCVYYLAIMCAVSIPVFSPEILLANVIISLLHMLIELGKFLYTEKLSNAKGKKYDRKIYMVTHLLHIGYLTAIAYYLTIKGVVIHEQDEFRTFMDVIGLSELVVVSWIITILLLDRPANTLIQKLLKSYKPQERLEIKIDNNAGRFIGTVERIVMLIFITLGEYSAVGLVLTAKSIARYDRISKDKDFAEHYLLGTLLSTLIVIVCFCVMSFLGSYG